MNLKTRFDLAALARGQGKAGQIEFKPVAPRLWFETELYRIIAGVLREFDRFKPDLMQAAGRAKSELTQDAYSLADIVGALRSAFSQATQLAQPGIGSLFRGEARRHDEKWLDQVNRVIGIDLKGVVASAQVKPTIDLATQTNVALIKGLTDEVAKRIETKVLDLVSRGASNREIAKTLTEIGGFGKNRAKLIAVDQAGKFNGDLNRIRQTQAGVTSYTWSTVRDNRVRPAHRAREGQTFRWDNPPSDGHPGRAVRCFKGSAEVDLANGCNKLWRRFYRGPIVAVSTGEGRLLEATPNHPILTRRGWLPIHALEKGDYLVERAHGVPILQQNDNNLVTSFYDLFRALNAAKPSQSTDGTVLDFHGDGSEDNIDVVVTDGDLLERARATLVEGFEQFLLAGACGNSSKPEFNAFCPRDPVGAGLLDAPYGGVSGLRQTLALLVGHPRHPDVVSGRATASFHAMLSEYAVDDQPLGAEAFSKSKDALAGLVEVYDLLLRKVVPAVMGLSTEGAVLPEALSSERLGQVCATAVQKGRHVNDALPVGYQFTRVVEKTVSEFSGHVFNLETNTGWYFSDDFVAHNCRCVARAILDLDGDQDRKDRTRARRAGTRAVAEALGLSL